VPRFLLQVVFSFVGPCTFLPDPVMCEPIFKLLFRVPVGSWWLLVGIVPRGQAWFRFYVGPPRLSSCFLLFFIRVFRFEVQLSELPF